VPDDSDDFVPGPDVEAVIDDDDDRLATDLSDGSRHYEQDPNQLARFARDEDEVEIDDELELDQAELGELGLVLDDPHQPEPE
jgi:hypothetical protein